MSVERWVAFPEAAYEWRRLVSAGIPIRRETFGGQGYMLIPFSQFERSCSMLGINVHATQLVRTGHPHIFLPRVQNDLGRRDTAAARQAAAIQEGFLALLGHGRSNSDSQALQHAAFRASQVVNHLQRQLRLATANLIAVKNSIVQARGAQAERQRLAKQARALLGHTKLARCNLTRNPLTFETQPVVIRHGRNTYDIGVFEITMDVVGTEHTILMTNRTRQVDGFHHPHVNRDGRPCFGNINEEVHQAVADRDILLAVNLCLVFLESYSSEWGYHPFVHIASWPSTSQQRRFAR